MLKFISVLISTISFCFSAFGQCAIPTIAGTSTIGKESVFATGKTKTESFRAARSWIVKKYPNYSRIIQVEDASAGQIIYKATAEVPYGRFKSMIFTVTIDSKDNKSRCVIDGLSLMGRNSGSYSSASMNDLSIDGDACDAVSKRFQEIENGIRECLTAKHPIVPRPSF